MSEEIHVRRMTDGDTKQLVALFRRCYGNTYPAPHFYDDRQLNARVADGRLRSVVATQEETVVGHSSIRACHPGALVCETGHTVVDPNVRGTGVLRRLGGALSQLVMTEGFRGYVHYPTTAHSIMQRASVAYGGHETGVMLDYLPQDTDYRALQATNGRIAVTVAFQPLAAMRPLPVCLPERYAELLGDVYERLQLPRSRIYPAAHRGRQEPGTIEVERSRERSTIRMSVSGTMADLASQVDDLLQREAPLVSFIDLPLNSAAIHEQVDILTGIGFFYAGLLPDFGASDILRLQRLSKQQPDQFAPTLENERGRQLLAWIRHDAGI